MSNTAQLAKAALRRLAVSQQEPTPENYAQAWAAEAGEAGVAAAGRAAEPSGDAIAREWAALCERLLRESQRQTRQWTVARRRDSLQRVFDGSRSDSQRLLQRLQGLLGAWSGEGEPETAPETAPELPTVNAGDHRPWLELCNQLHATVQVALPTQDERAAELADRLSSLSKRLPALDANLLQDIDAACLEAQSLLGQRHRLVYELRGLCGELSEGLVDLAEDDEHTQGMLKGLQVRLGDADLPSVRALRAARATFNDARSVQRGLRQQRRAAHDALKSMIQRLLSELGELDAHTDRFGSTLQQHVAAVQRADSLQSLAEVVRALVTDSQAVRQLVLETRTRLAGEHDRAQELHERVRSLEAELRLMADAATTDALTQVANRRGLQSAFESEVARLQRAGDAAAPLSLALIDIDNFKKLNDSLGHAAGDIALKSLATAVRERLRPGDHLARFGGEEFVVILPGMDSATAAQTITRLQRSLTEALFLHGQQEVFVTFSAGTTTWRPGEALEASLERADEGLYEAKRSGKNRTCMA